MGKVADRYNLHVNPRYADKERKEAFEAEIDRELTQIVNTTTGLLLLTALSTMKHTVEIQPYLDLTAYGTDPCNGTEDPVRPTKPDSRVRVAPFAYAGPRCAKTLKDREGAALPGAQKEEILFHELVHGLRRVTGLYKSVSLLRKGITYDSRE